MSLRVGILTVSDRSSRGERPDSSGAVTQRQVIDRGWETARTDIISDDFLLLEKTLTRWVDEGDLDVILTIGGTGFGPRDVTPEATQAVIERPAPGLTEAMRAASLYDAGKPCGVEANAAKYLAAEAGFRACTQAVMTHGGMGYAKEFHVERLLREVMITRLAPVSPQLILCNIAEKALGLPKSY